MSGDYSLHPPIGVFDSLAGNPFDPNQFQRFQAVKHDLWNVESAL